MNFSDFDLWNGHVFQMLRKYVQVCGRVSYNISKQVEVSGCQETRREKVQMA